MLLSPLYDPVCVSAFFESVPPTDYVVNRAIDTKLRAFSWDDLESLLKQARLLRVGNTLRIAKLAVKKAQADWPAILKGGPGAVRRSVQERLHGGVALSA